jgi:hypothetical protein
MTNHEIMKGCPLGCSKEDVVTYTDHNGEEDGYTEHNLRVYEDTEGKFRVSCSVCGVDGPTTDTRREAIDQWNILSDALMEVMADVTSNLIALCKHCIACGERNPHAIKDGFSLIFNTRQKGA